MTNKHGRDYPIGVNDELREECTLASQRLHVSYEKPIMSERELNQLKQDYATWCRFHYGRR